MKFLILISIFINLFANTDYFDSLILKPYDLEKLEVLLSKYENNPKKEYLEKIYHVSTMIHSEKIKKKIIELLHKNGLFKKMLKKNSYQNYLIFENLNLLKEDELKLFKKNITKYKGDIFYKKLFEIKNKKINTPELFGSVIHVNEVLDEIIAFGSKEYSKKYKENWLNRNGYESLLNIFIYSYVNPKKSKDLEKVFKSFSNNKYLWEYLLLLQGEQKFSDQFYKHLYDMDKETYYFGYIENLNSLSEINYAKGNFIDSYYFSLSSFKALIELNNDKKKTKEKFNLFLKIKSNFKKSLAKILLHFQSNGDKKTYNKILKESNYLRTYNLI